MSAELDKLRPYNNTVHGASGQVLPILGELPVTLVTPNSEIVETLLVYSTKSGLTIDVLLGMNILQQASMDFPNEELIFMKNTNLLKEPCYPAPMKITINSGKILNGVHDTRIKIFEPESNLSKCVYNYEHERKNVKEFEKELQKSQNINNDLTKQIINMNKTLITSKNTLNDDFRSMKDLIELKNETLVRENTNELNIHLLDELIV